jgi:hypothetical protein
MVARHGSVVLLSGWVTRKAAVEMSTPAAVNGSIEDLARTMALQLAPVRANAMTRRSGDRVSRRQRPRLISITLCIPIQWGASEPPITSPKRSFS